MTGDTAEVERHGEPAVLIRTFGWMMLAVLAAFLIANVLNLRAGFGGVLTGDPVIILIYAVCCGLGLFYVFRDRNVSLRYDSSLIHGFNVYLIRAAFWAVFLTGMADIIIAFMRTEGLLDTFFSDHLVTQLGRPLFVGAYVHFPMVLIGLVLAFFTRTLGFTWLALLIVGAELLIVLSRFVFSYEQAFMSDLVRYWYAALFLFSSAYTLFDEGHVRVDVFYAGLRDKTKGYVNGIGTILLGLTTCWVIIVIGFNGKSAIINGPVMNVEVSQSGSVGLYIKYQMAAFLGVFAITMLIQFVSYLFEAFADYREEPGKRVVSSVAH